MFSSFRNTLSYVSYIVFDAITRRDNGNLTFGRSSCKFAQSAFFMWKIISKCMKTEMESLSFLAVSDQGASGLLHRAYEAVRG